MAQMGDLRRISSRGHRPATLLDPLLGRLALGRRNRIQAVNAQYRLTAGPFPPFRRRKQSMGRLYQPLTCIGRSNFGHFSISFFALKGF